MKHRPRLNRLALAALIGAAGCASPAAAPPSTADSYANVLVGRLANLREDHRAASDRYYHALASAPADHRLLQDALAASLAAGDVERARHVAEMADGRQAEVPLAYLVRGADALSLGRYRMARDKFARVRGTATEELCERVLSAWTKVGEGRLEAAGVELALLDAPPPFSGVYLYQHAMSLDYAGRNDDALRAYQEAAASGLFLPPAAVRHADLLVRTGARDEALALLRELSAQSPNAEVDAAAARIAAGEGAGLAPLTPARGAAVGLYGLGALYLRDTDTVGALVTFMLAVMLDPELDAARMAFAETQFHLDHYDVARAAVGAIAPDSPYAANAAMSEAWALIEQGRNDEALARAEAGADGASPRSQRTLGEIYARLGRNAEAEALYTRLIESAGEEADWRLYFARGAARHQLGDWPRAEADLERALALAPERPEVLNYLGYSWVDRGDRLTEGLALIQRAVDLRPNSGAIIDSLGWAHYKMGDYATALTYLERAVELQPADPILNDHLGDVYWRVGRRIEARFQWRRALAFKPDAADHTVIERKIETGLAPLRQASSANR